jgi:hypothetical protein
MLASVSRDSAENLSKGIVVHLYLGYSVMALKMLHDLK